MSSGIRKTSSGIRKTSSGIRKIDPEIDHFLDASWNQSLDGLCWILVPNSILGWLCLPTGHQQSTNIFQKSMPRCIPSWTPFVDCFLVGVCFQLWPIGSQKTRFSLTKNNVFWKMVCRSNHRFLIPFCCQHGSILAARSSIIHPEIDFKRHQTMIDFWIDFLAILASFWEPSWDHVGYFFD